MSGTSKKTERRLTSQKNTFQNFADVKLSDFANSTNSHGRLKKSVTNTAIEVHKITVVGNDRAWYDAIEDSVEDDAKEVVLKKSSRKSKKSSAVVHKDVGNEYPVDIWFLISEYIRPEDVGRFACICKNSWYVVGSAQFWFHLYKRYYRPAVNMPESLEPQSMVRLYGLRFHVVRALYFMYPPFVERIRAQQPFEAEPQLLLKRKCVLLWHQHQKNSNVWTFYFKLKECKISLERQHRPKRGLSHLLEMLEDITINPEEDCKVLQITCFEFIEVPMVMGLTLCGVKLGLSHNLRYYRIRLDFGSGLSSVMFSSHSVILDPVLCYRILDWWHPKYPHSSSSFTAPFGHSD